MSISFKTPSGHVHDSMLCEPQLNLLAHAQAIELNIGSQCGGHGICGNDRVLIPRDLQNLFSPITEIEREHLNPDELEAGWRLGCQCFPNSSELEATLAFTNSPS